MGNATFHRSSFEPINRSVWRRVCTLILHQGRMRVLFRALAHTLRAGVAVLSLGLQTNAVKWIRLYRARVFWLKRQLDRFPYQ